MNPIFSLPIGAEAKFDVSLDGPNPVLTLKYEGADMNMDVEIEVKSLEALESLKKIFPNSALFLEAIEIVESAIKRFVPAVETK